MTTEQNIANADSARKTHSQSSDIDLAKTSGVSPPNAKSAATIRKACHAGQYPTTRDNAIFHEAGHCIVSAALGWEITRVEIMRCEHCGVWEGKTETVIPDELLYSADHASVMVAGNRAQELFCPAWDGGRQIDEHIFACDVAKGDGAAVWGIYQKTNDILKANLPALMLLVKALRWRRVVRGKHLSKILAQVKRSEQ